MDAFSKCVGSVRETNRYENAHTALELFRLHYLRPYMAFGSHKPSKPPQKISDNQVRHKHRTPPPWLRCTRGSYRGVPGLSRFLDLDGVSRHFITSIVWALTDNHRMKVANMKIHIWQYALATDSRYEEMTNRASLEI